MSDVTQEHPEFFKAPSEHDVVAETDISPEGTEGESSVDALIEVAALPLLVEANPSSAPAHNRRDASLIALLGGVIFALLYAGLVFVLIAFRQEPAAVLPSTISFLATPIYWLTSAAFTGLFALLTVVISRGSWLPYVLGSFFVALLTYVAALGAGLIAIHAWELTFTEAQTALWEGVAFSPLLLITPVLGREISLWLGLWISHRGKRLRAEASGVAALSQ